MKTIKENVNHKIIINKSVFITYLFRVDNEEQALSYINTIKYQYKDATHCCYAYIVDKIERFHDANEPVGTAGKPILEVLLKNNLNYVVAIVVRYYGGTKLGYGGLIRAYSRSVSEALKLTKLENVVWHDKIMLNFPYYLTKEIDYLLKDCHIIKREYKEKITYLVLIERRLLSDIINKLQLLNEVEIKKNNEF